MLNWRLLKISDPFIWLSVGSLLFCGLLALFSATFKLQLKLGGDPFLFVKRQSLSLIFGLVVLACLAYLDYRHLKKIAWFLYLLTLGLLGVVVFTGASAQGAQRWLPLGPFSFQPSEVAKLTLIIALAAFLSERRKLTNPGEVFLLLLIVACPFLLIFKQPDLGTALVIMSILIGMLGVSESSPKLLILLTTPLLSLLCRPILALWLIYLLAVIISLFLSRAFITDWLLILGTNIAVGLVFPSLWGMLKVYQRQRIIAFLNPAADPYGAGYHTLQSKIAVGNGGFFGKGFLAGSQTQLQFIPEQHSDFIFSAVGEEVGFIGSLIVLALFALLIWRALSLAYESPDRFGQLLAAGIATMLLFHLLANVGMVLGLLPVVGIPLPFMSFGGTALFVNLAGIGLLQSIAMRRQKLIF